MFWPFLELHGQLVYCPLADFGANGVREGQDLYAQAVIAQPVTAHMPLKNASELKGKIAVLQRGICDFVTKVLYAQQAGAIAVLMANNSDNGSGEAFIMDAGQCYSHLAETVRIPAMMTSRSHSTSIFQQIREAYLDRQELYLTIRFLGPPTASRVLAQQESLKQQNRDAARNIELKQQWEHQQHEAASLLRNRLDEMLPLKRPTSARIIITPTTSTSESALDSSPASSLKSNSVCSPRPSRVDEQSYDIDEENHHDTCSLLGSGVHTAAMLAMLHWCPMTTALVILDVQHYFTLPNGYVTEQRADPSVIKSRKALGATSQSRRNDTNFYERVDNELIPTIQDVLLASRAVEGMEVIYSVAESATCDGRERSRTHKCAGIHVPKRGFGAQVPKQIAPHDEKDILLPRTGVNVFTATNLDYVLRNLMITHIVVMGISVLGSIESCVQSALDRGYQVTVLKETLLPLSKTHLDNSKKPLMLENVSRQGAQVLTAADFVAKLQSFH